MKKPVTANAVVRELKKLAVPANKPGMARFGINVEHALGVSVPNMRALAKEIGPDHELAAQLWKTRIHEARILAGFIEEPQKVTAKQMDRWVSEFDSWDMCDLICNNLFDKTDYAWGKAVEWSARDSEFVKRAGFALMASLSVHDKKAPDKAFRALLPIIKREAHDERNYVKKAVNWALRQIGKRNAALNKSAIRTAEQIQKQDSKAARWIAKDALRELWSEKVQGRLC